MSMSDPIADMLTRIRNASSAKLPAVTMPSSRIKTAIAEVLKEQGYVQDYRLEEEGTPRKALTVELKYEGKRRVPVIEGVQRVSSPSCRVHVGRDEIPRVLGGLGVAILSTSRGVMTGRAARQQNLGGEVLCYIW
ncbi:MAG: 30S ribosomal protein S8 [Lentisphaerae bacterium]|nr:30S ribosomal protein S8 [Lentisphaerota bacterium]